MFWNAVQYNQIDTSNSEEPVATIVFDTEGGGSRLLQNVCTVGYASMNDATTNRFYQ